MFTSILIPTDGSEKAVIAASKAVELAKEQGAKLTAVVVIDPFPYIGLGEASAFGLQAYLSEAQAMATQSLDGVRAMAEAAAASKPKAASEMNPEEKEKRAKAIKKKLKSIAELKEKGGDLDEAQQKKLASEGDLVKELESLGI